LPKTNPDLLPLLNRIADALERARIFGHHVHHMTHLFDIGDLEESSLDLELKLYLAQYKRFLHATKFGVRFSEDDAIEAFGRVWAQLIARFKGDAWKRTDRAVEELRQKYPKLLK